MAVAGFRLFAIAEFARIQIVVTFPNSGEFGYTGYIIRREAADTFGCGRRPRWVFRGQTRNSCPVDPAPFLPVFLVVR